MKTERSDVLHLAIEKLQNIATVAHSATSRPGMTWPVMRALATMASTEAGNRPVEVKALLGPGLRVEEAEPICHAVWLLDSSLPALGSEGHADDARFVRQGAALAGLLDLMAGSLQGLMDDLEVALLHSPEAVGTGSTATLM